MPAYDYSEVADIYDGFCVFDADIPFFREQVSSTRGAVLELMAGTGRVSLPMIDTGTELTCVDLFPPMLSVLADKLRSRDLCARLVCADVCRLPFESSFQMVVLPFQGFTELVGEDAQMSVLAEVARLLPAGGRFVCTSHNPSVRARTINGQWHELGSFDDQAGRTLVLHLRTAYSGRPDVVVGTQRIEILDGVGKMIERRAVELEFSLVSAEKILDMAASVGLHPVSLYGDYHGEAYDESSSPCFIAVLERSG
jgi:SAM-dependent methyltransferase